MRRRPPAIFRGLLTTTLALAVLCGVPHGVSAVEPSVTAKPSSDLALMVDGAVHWSQINPSQAAGKADDGFGVSLGTGLVVWEGLFISVQGVFQRNTPGKDAELRLTPLAGLGYRFDSLPVYPEFTALLGAECVRAGGSWDATGVLSVGLALYVPVGYTMSIGLGVSQLLRLRDLEDDPGIFLSLFRATARNRLIGLSFRWSYPL